MKRQILCTAFAAALTLTLVVPAAAEENKIGDVVGHTYYTDIAAQINGHPLRSYNIGGETAVVAEDLREYGFFVVWDGEARTLTVERGLEEEVTGDYQPQGQTQTVGAQAGDIYYTDIKTYVQGERVTSYAIGGETAIRFSELERTGTLAWEEEARTASLTLAEDPMEFALERMEQEVKDWQMSGGSNSSWQRFPNAYGVLLERSYSGTPHGGVSSLTQVYSNGRALNIGDLLPAYPAAYLEPREIQVDETSRYVTFLTPVKEVLDYTAGTSQNYGECRCTLDLGTGTLTWRPVDAPPEDWWVDSTSAAGDPDAPLVMSVSLASGGGQAAVEQENIPSEHISVSMSDTSVFVEFYTAFLGLDGLTGAENWASTPCEQAYQALSGLGLPSVVQENFSQTNSQELREQARQWFQVTLNGAPVSGDLWWSMGNNHRDLNFTYDQPISLSEGDVLTLWVGVPKEN